MGNFATYIGIDYSGRGTPATRSAGLQVYAGTQRALPRRVAAAAAGKRRAGNWSRRAIAEWLIGRARSARPLIVGIDFSFSLPASYFRRYRLPDWDTFLADFVAHWPTDREGATVEQFRPGNPRTGSNDELRLTERWTSSAMSNFQFDVQGQVAKSTHAGIPWLYRIRQAVGARLHFWPFDGWELPSGRSVVAEVYPSILRRRYPRRGRTVDQHDAYAIARWLREQDLRQTLRDVYCVPPLAEAEREIARREGWILGVM